MTWFLGWFAAMDLWKIVGIVGQVVFGMRFIVQWLVSERAGRSVIPVAFWYLSVGGGADPGLCRPHPGAGVHPAAGRRRW